MSSVIGERVAYNGGGLAVVCIYIYLLVFLVAAALV